MEKGTFVARVDAGDAYILVGRSLAKVGPPEVRSIQGSKGGLAYASAFFGRPGPVCSKKSLFRKHG